jgi:hypothetical protein
VVVAGAIAAGCRASVAAAAETQAIVDVDQLAVAED